MELNVVPRLAKGSWPIHNIGVGCIMNLKSWEQANLEDVRGVQINDRPRGYHKDIRAALVYFNDILCLETKQELIQGKKVELLCSECVSFLLEMADAFDGSDQLIITGDCRCSVCVPNAVNRDVLNLVDHANLLLGQGKRYLAKQQLQRAAAVYRKAHPRPTNYESLERAATLLNDTKNEYRSKIGTDPIAGIVPTIKNGQLVFSAT